jgi:hypothetical protein
MTSSFRLLLAVFLAGLALAAGLTRGEDKSDQTARDDLSSAQSFDLRSRDEISSFIERISAAGLFPDADIALGKGQSASEALSLEEVEIALSDPKFAALVSEGGEWTVLLLTDTSQISELRISDELQNGWIVANISSAKVLLQRDDETRELHVFRGQDD